VCAGVRIVGGVVSLLFFFFFQAEDGIRDGHVTGVQTCALPIFFKSLKANRLLRPGDTIALGTPIFTPYIEMPHLEDYALNVVNVHAPQENRFQFTDTELKKLEDPKIKAFFIVNPGNPTGVALSKETIGKIANLVKT